MVKNKEDDTTKLKNLMEIVAEKSKLYLANISVKKIKAENGIPTRADRMVLLIILAKADIIKIIASKINDL